MRDDRIDARKEATRLTEPVEEAAALARKLGLDPYPVNYWIVDHDEMNELIAYGGLVELAGRPEGRHHPRRGARGLLRQQRVVRSLRRRAG